MTSWFGLRAGNSPTEVFVTHAQDALHATATKLREPDRDARVASVAVRLVCRSESQLFRARDVRDVTDFERDVVRGLERRAVVVLRRDAVVFDRALVDFRRDAVDLAVVVFGRRAVVAFDFVRDVVAFRFAVDLVFVRDVVALRFAVDLVFERAVVALRFAVDLVFERAVVAFRFAVDLVFVRDVVALRFAVDLIFVRDVVAFRFAVDFAFAVDFRLAELALDFEPDLERDELRDLVPAEREDDDLASPDWARCLFTVRAAISSARSVDSPFSFSDSLTCSY
jgi:hypothetical protein